MSHNAAIAATLAPISYEESIFVTGESYFKALMEEIACARKTIHLETYIFNHDDLGKQMVNVLSEAAKRGVKVRVLVDGCGTPQWGARLARQLEKSGVETRVFHPFPWQLWNWSRSTIKSSLLLRWIYLFLNANVRNHRKICLIDDHILYAGSMNISKTHLSVASGGQNWRDTGVRLVGDNFEQLKKALESAWFRKPLKERLKEAFKQVRRNPHIRLNYTRHRRRLLHKNLIRMMAKCRRRIWITNAYFIPDNVLLNTLRDAADSGVDVRILLPNKSDVRMMPWASSAFYHHLLQAGVRIFEYLPSVLHAKSLILDEKSFVGSSNLNHRSLLHDLEIDILLTSEVSKKILEEQFLADLKNSREVYLDKWRLRHRRRRFLGRLALYLKYWI
ncbi:MAG TPA: phospholipase D-like domain-containing protein [Coxiellaceae bacterium]|nr:phospholipase D-like domain-containing protein [Coxiellaceae bacterium]